MHRILVERTLVSGKLTHDQCKHWEPSLTTLTVMSIRTPLKYGSSQNDAYLTPVSCARASRFDGQSAANHRIASSRVCSSVRRGCSLRLLQSLRLCSGSQGQGSRHVGHIMKPVCETNPNIFRFAGPSEQHSRRAKRRGTGSVPNWTPVQHLKVIGQHFGQSMKVDFFFLSTRQ
jgi:hypothetical protein